MANDWDPPDAPQDSPGASDGGRRRTRWLIVAGAAVLILAALVAWRLSSLTQSSQQNRGRFAGMAQPVGVASVGTHDIRVVLNQIGTVAPVATVTVQAQLSGLLLQIGFKEGQLVRKGDFLAQIDPRPYQIALEQFRAQLLKDQAALEQARVNLERYRALQERDSIAKQTVDDQVWLVQQNEAAVRVDQAQIDNQKLNLTYCRIVSPVDGRVGLRLVDVGNYVQANSATGIVVVTQLHPISVVFTVPEDQVPGVLEQFHGAGPLQVVAFDRSNQTKLATGMLGAIDTQVDVTTGTVKMRAMFDNADNALYPEQFVNVTLLVKVLHDAVVMPKTAVQYGSTGSFVYALSEDNTVSVRPVALGAQDGELVAVQSGIAVGDRVVTDGADQLRSGSHVTVRGDGPNTNAAMASSATPEGQPRQRGQGQARPGQDRRSRGNDAPSRQRDQGQQ